MNKTLIIYSTIDGQTLSICKKMKNILDGNAEVELVALSDFSSKYIQYFDDIILGASIRYGKHRPEVHKFVETHRKVLEKKRTAFFSVNVVARKSNKNTPETNPYIKNFFKTTSWRPNYLAVFAGKIDYPKYGFFDKQMIRLIMYMTKGPTDTKGVYEFTDWNMVAKFTQQISMGR